MFGVILSTLVGLMHLYLWKRLVKDTTAKGTARRVGTVAFAFLALLVFVTLILGRSVPPSTARWFAWPGYIWFGMVIYLFLTTLVLEIPRLLLRGWVRRRPLEATATTDAAPPVDQPTKDEPAKPQVNQSRRLFLARATAVAAGAASTSLVGVGLGNALGPPDLLRVPVALRRLDPSLAGFRIAVVSDIHLGPVLGRSHTERIVRMINESEPDLVAVVGDLADGTVADLGRAAEPLADLAPREGSFFVTGNHEYFVEPEAWIREMDRLGVHPLRNERTTISRGGAAIDLAGVNDLAGRTSGDGPDFDRALDGRRGDRPVVLLAHQPVQVEDAARRGVDLQLSGHTHGGQLYPFHHFVPLAQPAVSGLARIEDTWLYVTRGAGFWGPPIRVGAPPDISLIELRPDAP
ncbi:metallophosphoesterase [Actinophytocola xanthii]|uniref:Metallophosphatase n=1 Tax=Actinophytocola xanthii TaxID=1912961 RepID=A0A1Q8CSN4_9PSEU|nr:metallophosphoesterase [Actinophytocola xanthii]OLF17381.1 metallophosphatase [Actinophytocola xanthii]